MTEIVNLRRVKKLRARADAEAAAQQNRVRFGRTAGEQARDRLAAKQADARAQNARLDPKDPA